MVRFQEGCERRQAQLYGQLGDRVAGTFCLSVVLGFTGHGSG